MTLLQESQALKKTPLYDKHLALGAKIVDFGGWAMPVYYSGILAEHKAVRESCAAFDVSHLGEVRVQGKGAFDFLQARLTNDLSRLRDGRMQYHLLCDEKGLTIDDILVYRDAVDQFYLIVNASNIEIDYHELLRYAPESVKVSDESARTACVAVQGPAAEDLLTKAFGWDLSTLGYYAFRAETLDGRPVWVSRSGYTGEDGFEVFSSNEQAASVWDAVLAAGAPPAGLGARNTLRLEAGNALYGHELTRSTTPLEAGLGWAVSFEKSGGFVGRDALIRQKQDGCARHLVGFKVLDRAPAREGYPIFHQGKKTGEVTSGSFTPTAGGNIGMGYVRRGHEAPGTPIEIEVHGRRVPAEVVKRPFVATRHKKGGQK